MKVERRRLELKDKNNKKVGLIAVAVVVVVVAVVAVDAVILVGESGDIPSHLAEGGD